MIEPTFKDTITVYNHYTEDGEKTIHKWGRIVLNNCYFGKVSSDESGNLAKTSSDMYVCRIPKSPKFVFLYRGEPDTFHLAKGDIIVNGITEDDICDKSGHRPADILQKYSGNAFEVKQVSLNTRISFAQHYRATGE